MSVDVEAAVIRVIKESNPKTTQQLILLLKDKLDLTESQITDCIIKLEYDGKIELRRQDMLHAAPRDLQFYLRSKAAYWYYLTLLLTFASTIVIFGIQGNSLAIIIRYVMGFIYVLGLPGYSLVMLLFPVESAAKGIVKMDLLTRFGFSVVFSIAIVSIVGLALNYTIGVTLDSLVLSLSPLTIFLATAAIYRGNLKFNEQFGEDRSG